MPAGDYWVQPFVNVYTRFARADGKTVWLHMDQWEGQDWKRSPGNIYGDPVRVSFDPRASTPIRLVADKVIPPIQPPTDSAQVKRIRIQSDPQQVVGSPDLSRRDGAAAEGLRPASGGALPGELRARALLLRAPGNFGSGGAFDAFWAAAGTPRLIYVTLQHPTPYYDDSCGVNSDNNGPYGDAIMQELIPAVESRFRVIREPWARMLTGGSTGGWIAAAHQVLHPDFYGGAFASCPDSVDFRYHQIVDIYSDANAYFIDKGWMKIDRPNQVAVDGNVQSMMKDENRYELVVGDKSRSGGQWDIWEATCSPSVPTGIRGGSGTRTRASSTRRSPRPGAVRSPAPSREQLAEARAEGGAQAERLRRRHGLVLPEQRRREAQRVPVQGVEPAFHRRDRL